jgi:hypothetical protein
LAELYAEELRGDHCVEIGTGQRVVRPFILRADKCHYLIVIDKEAKFHRYVLKWFIYNNSNAKQMGYRPLKSVMKF